MRLGNGMFMSVRRAKASDGPRCAEIFLEGRRRASPWQPADRFCLADFYDCVEEELVVVAEAWGRVVGFVALAHSERFIHALFVDRAWQNRGIGSLLLGEALDLLDGRAELACSVHNKAARAFYRRQGWEEVGRRAAQDDPHVVFRKTAAN